MRFSLIKKILLVFVLVTITFFIDSSVVYAAGSEHGGISGKIDDNTCLYEGVLNITYNPGKKVATYEANEVNDCNFNSESTCVQVYVGDAKKKKLDLNEWDFFKSKTGEFKCPTIYFYKSCFTNDINGATTCDYYFSPGTFNNKQFDILEEFTPSKSVSSVNALSEEEEKSTTSNSSYKGKCTDTQNSAFKKEINDILLQYTNEMQTLTDNLEDNQSALYYQSKYDAAYKLGTGVAFSKAARLKNGLSSNLNKYECVVDEEIYNTLINNIAVVTDSYTNSYKNKIMDKLVVARSNSTNPAEYDKVISSMNGDSSITDYLKSTETWKVSMTEYYTDFSTKYSAVANSCKGVLDPSLVSLINKILNWLKIIVPILLIVLGTVDFSKAVIMEDKGDEMKKAVSTFAKRCLIAIAIFFVPTIIHILVELFNKFSNIPLTDLPGCGIK